MVSAASSMSGYVEEWERARNLQGCSQPHSPGWAKLPLSSNFDQFFLFFLKFFSFSSLFLGDSPTRKGPGYATGNLRQYSTAIFNTSVSTWLLAWHSHDSHIYRLVTRSEFNCRKSTSVMTFASYDHWFNKNWHDKNKWHRTKLSQF